MINANDSAHDIASSRQHKSVSASDVLKALEQIQFGDMVDGLTHELNGTRFSPAILVLDD